MRFSTLSEWLHWQESLNPKEIDLGLERVAAVLGKLHFSANFFCPVITVAGTNGKGSTVAFIESILRQSDISVGSYTSPHLFKYNERIRINQQPVSDNVLCEAFDVVDQARGDIALTYFEFGTLASLVVFKKYNVHVAVLEVGLGGRLDAVNVIDADVAVISSIGIDHVDWLGDDIEVIAREKAGIMRAHKPAVISIFSPPESLLKYASENNVELVRLGQDYLYQGIRDKEVNNSWQLNAAGLHLGDLPVPALKGGFQLQNAAAAIMAISLLLPDHTLTHECIAKGLLQVRLPGRYQQIANKPAVLVDVAHNEQSAQKLAELLNDTAIEGKTIALVAMLADKAVAEVLTAVNPQIDHWVTAGLETGRAMTAKNMAQAVRGLHTDVKLSVCENVIDACIEAQALATDRDRIIVFGSFYTVSAAADFFSRINNS